MVIFVWGAKLYATVMLDPPAGALEVYAVGKQWMWKFQHPDGQREIDELHVPVGHPVKMTMTSQDVIHSFFVPAFRIKMDVVPGRYTTVWFEASKPGVYHLFCAEYCGTAHSGMRGRVVALPPSAVPGVAQQQSRRGVDGLGRSPASSSRWAVGRAMMLRAWLRLWLACSARR